MEKLKPCPFCGSEAETKHYDDDSSLIIYCPTCNKDWDLKGEKPGERWAADFEFAGWNEDDDNAAIAAWNRRAIDRDELLGIADDLEEELDCFDGEYDSNILFAEDVLKFEREMAARIRKAVMADGD